MEARGAKVEGKIEKLYHEEEGTDFTNPLVKKGRRRGMP